MTGVDGAPTGNITELFERRTRLVGKDLIMNLLLLYKRIGGIAVPITMPDVWRGAASPY